MLIPTVNSRELGGGTVIASLSSFRLCSSFQKPSPNPDRLLRSFTGCDRHSLQTPGGADGGNFHFPNENRCASPESLARPPQPRQWLVNWTKSILLIEMTPNNEATKV